MTEAQKIESIYTDHNGVTVTAMSSQRSDKIYWGHSYMVSGLSAKTPGYQMVEFQHGPVPLNGPNGLTNEALLAILIHRTEHLDSQFPCVQNRMAIRAMRDALELFETRTKERQQRNVEGQNVV